MDELMDMIVSDDSPSQISDRIKDILFGKAAERSTKDDAVADGNLRINQRPGGGIEN